MKQFLLSVLFLSVLISASGQSKTEKENIELTVQSAFDAISELNIEKMKSYCTHDLIILENGIVWNLDTLVMKVNMLKSVSDFKRINRFDFFETQIHGNTAWTCYYNEATGVSKGKDFGINWLESAVLVNEKGSWKIRMLHSTLLSRK